MNDVTLTQGKTGIIEVKFSEEFIKSISENLAEKVSECFAKNLHNELLFAKGVAELKAIESGKLKAKRGEEAMKLLEEEANRD